MSQNKLWEGASDIFTDYEGTITDATAENGQYGWQVKLTFDEIDGREEPVFEFYSLPDSWESGDGGETISRVDGKDPAENPLKRSNAWQRFIMAAAACGNGVRDAIENPLQLTSWIGCRFRMEAVEGKTYTDRDTKEKKKAKDKNYPVEFLGKDSATVTSATIGNGKVDNLSVLTDLHNPVVESQIAESAKTLPYPAWFQQSYKAITDAGVDVNSIPDLVNAMSQRQLYESLGGRG